MFDPGKNVSDLTTLIKGAVPDGSIEDDRIFKSLAVSYQNPNIIYLGTEGNGIFKSTDGGNTFLLVANLREWLNKQP